MIGKSFSCRFLLEFQDAGLGVDKDRAAPKSRYLPPHLRGKPGASDERPPPEPRNDDYDKGGRSSKFVPFMNLATFL